MTVFAMRFDACMACESTAERQLLVSQLASLQPSNDGRRQASSTGAWLALILKMYV